jgi:hypothetical protein
LTECNFFKKFPNYLYGSLKELKFMKCAFPFTVRLAAIALTSVMVMVPGLAQNAQSANSPVQTAKPSATHPLKRAQVRVAPATQSHRPMSPMDRVIAPYVTKIKAGNSATKAPGSTLHPQSSGNGGNGSVSFPGFVATPFLSINNGDNSSTYDSVSADFNGDGKIDIATVQVDGTLNVILNPGSFASPSSVTQLAPNTTANASFPSISWLIAADMNGDGSPDLIAMDANNNAIIEWLNNGDGTFGTAASYIVAPSTGANWIWGGGLVVADFNGDGVPDVATIGVAPNAGFSSTQTVITEQTFLNNGKGTLTAGQESSATFADFYSGYYNEMDVVSNDGTTASGIALLLYDAGNVNGANTGIDVVVIPSTGNGVFTPAVEPAVPLVNDPYGQEVNGGVISTNLTANFKSSTASLKTKAKYKANSMAGSGIPTTDIVFITGDGAVYDAPYSPGSSPVAANLLAGQNTEIAPYIPPNSGTAPSLASSYIPYQEVLNVADMNGDGLQDILVYGNATVYIFPNSSGTFVAAPTQVAGATGGDQQPEPADFDGSGYNSFVNVDYVQNQIGYYENLGATSTSLAGQFYAAPLVTGANAGYGNYEAFGGNINVQASADLNGDGLLDVVAYDWSEQDIVNGTYYPDIAIGINKGGPASGYQSNGFTFTTAIKAATLSTLGGGLAFVEPVVISSAVGKSILIATSQGLYISTSTAGGAFSAPTALNLGVTIACPVNYADVADINGDGNPDIVVAYGGDSACGSGSTKSGYFTLLGNSDGSFGAATFTAFGSSLYQARLISFNAAGKLDLAVVDLPGNNAALGVHIIPGNGDGTFKTANAVEPVTNYIVSDIVPGDYNQDGKQDLTLTTEGQWNTSTGGIVPNTSGVLLVPATGDYTFGPASTANPGNYPLWGSYADFNGDGAPDLALAELYNMALSSYTDEPLVQILPNLGGGTFGAPIVEMDSSFDYGIEGTTYSGYTFTGNWANSGGADLLVTGSYNTALFINSGVTSMQLSASSTTPTQGANVTFTANLSQTVSALAPISGSVTFSDGGTVLGAAPVTNGIATLTISELPTGASTVTATYSGDAGHNTATASVGVTVTAAAPAFTMTASQGSLSLSQGATGTVTLNLAANGTFASAISFTCSGAPAQTSCTVSPGSVSLTANQGSNVTVVVATTPPNNTYQANEHAPWLKAMGGVSVAGLLLLMIPRRRRFSAMLTLGLLAVLSLGTLAALTGCSGGSGNKYSGTAAGTYTLTVTGTAGSITQSQTITLTITQ